MAVREPDRWDTRFDDDITELIPFNEFGGLEDADFAQQTAFGNESAVVHAPELDDLDDTDDLRPLRLDVPARFRAEADHEDPHPYRSHGHEITDVVPIQRGHHRKPAATSAGKGRLLIAAMAAGAAAAAAHSMTAGDDTSSTEAVVAADDTVAAGKPIAKSSMGVQVVTVASSSSAHTEELQKAVAFAQERAEREARMQRPLFVMPTKGIFTSGFGYRWGVLHAGVDIANSIGTPILAASDGVVIDVGPTAGYGAWVKLRHSDGTVTLYGHINSWNVSIGQRVMAGDQIATMGNRGNSTGPHLHFEVMLNGTDRVDPQPWLAKRGIGLGALTG
ncbi:M23 family metallopeptidase [Mycobacterium sp. MYCO198283]|uniref:M23 family metallopeptidase n=1 Tax=Mycobacterium sp. MYCO198283 TaxID=2883505 RepID=UPI001E5CB056|nr:M23 family metallopeptidase [Mycobacterium sp. MYCO198283]MCG5431014.1 M23 family metallopeptidase [Mycobacterium sp. MYCO198283]